MTFIESITLVLAIGYALLLLAWGEKKWGWLALALPPVAAFIVANHWQLLLVSVVATLLLAGVAKLKPSVFEHKRAGTLRSASQHTFTLALLIVAAQYVLNSWMLKAGIEPWLMRPDVVDAFLPIAGAIELKAIATLGYWDQQHPAAAVMLFVVLITGVICKRAFCGWACPLGLFGDYLYNARKRLIKNEYAPPAWIDWPLRMLKYVLLLGLIYIIVLGMPAAAIPNYLNGYYHKIADLKMGLLFVAPGLITIVSVIAVLMMAAWRRQAFCRYLCPYGAMLGITSFLSPLKIRRDKQHCLIEARGMNCDKCTRACPSNIIIHTRSTVWSDECQACMRCVDACPKKQALGFSLKNGKQMSAKGLLVTIIILMFAIPLVAHLSGFWHSQTPTEVRQQLIHKLDRIGH